MKSSDRQTEYWNRVAQEKQFTHPLDAERFRELVPKSAAILDVGCGCGRTWADLRANGYANVIGVDTAGGMIERGHRLHPQADLRLCEGTELPFPAGTFDAVILLAVLTCVPSDDAQRALIAGVGRVLRPDGILYVSDYPIQTDARNQSRYAQFESQYGRCGVFELPEGVVLRHHATEWIDDLLSSFPRVGFRVIDVPTMNGNMSKVFQYFGRKRNRECPTRPCT
ncbi:class I SAM-dependent methyltransferase [bacterium]|nr:class I SAM-dependent methyltransferase [bacterium]